MTPKYLESLPVRDLIMAAAKAVDAIDVDGPRSKAIKQHNNALQYVKELERRGMVKEVTLMLPPNWREK